MVPIEDYIAPDAPSGIPYIMTVDDEGRLGRAVMTKAVVTSMLVRRSSWRHLQEWGGINNSFALNLLAEEKERLAEEKRQEIEEIEKNYVAQIDQDIGELTKEIVQRIANRLITEGGNGSGALATPIETPTALPAEPAAAAEPAAVAEEAVVEETDEDDEEIAVLDDPYIDTPLCTTCNECTKLNGLIFEYNANKQAYIKDPLGGPYGDIVRAAELCPVHIIHPGKPKKPDEPGLDEWIGRAAPFN
jgi:ferredoxin